MPSAALALMLLAAAPEWVARSGDLEVHQVAVTDSARFLREWDRPGDNAQLTFDSVSPTVARSRPSSCSRVASRTPSASATWAAR